MLHNIARYNHYYVQILADTFPEEAVYYGRWRNFRAESKQEHDLEDVEEEELADELDLFAISDLDSALNEKFMARIQFADKRTQEMNWLLYDNFSQ